MSKLLIHNARIWACGDHPEARWMVIDPSSGYVTSLGLTSEAPLAEFAEDARRDMGGRRILPGLHEAHIHVSNLGQGINSLNLDGCKSVKELQNRLRTHLDKHSSADEWIQGFNFDDSLMDRMPIRDDIDAICRDRPVLLHRVCMHMGVCNSNALQLLNIDADTVCPEDGTIDKYPEGHANSGQPTGVLREGAVGLATSKIPAETAEQRMRDIRVAIDYCLRQGVTSIHSNEAGAWREYAELASISQLPIRVFYCAYWSGRNEGNFPERAGASRGAMLSCDRIKLFTDGALGADTAALSQPYTCSHNKGLLMYSQEVLNDYVLEATSRGFRLEMHVIGDAAVDCALTALKYAEVSPQKRPILTHCQILREDQLSKMRDHGVVANIQPQFLNTDARWLHKKLPSELIPLAYAWKTLLRQGIPCAGGSDAPVEDARPLLGMYDAIYRQTGDRQRDSKEQFKPDECLSVGEAVSLYTSGGAYATLREHDLGQLRPGYLADFVVISSSPTQDVIDHPHHLLEAAVDEVWVNATCRLSDGHVHTTGQN